MIFRDIDSSNKKNRKNSNDNSTVRIADSFSPSPFGVSVTKASWPLVNLLTVVLLICVTVMILIIVLVLIQKLLVTLQLISESIVD